MYNKQSVDLLTAGGALFSPCLRWRYALTRVWDESLPHINFLLLNPSTATAQVNDPTVERCQRRAYQQGYGGLCVTNLFAWRSTDPGALRHVSDPVGSDNDRVIIECALAAQQVVCGWGNHGAIAGRSEIVLGLLARAGVRPYCLAITRAGQPRHPLYVSYDRQPFLFRPLP